MRPGAAAASRPRPATGTITSGDPRDAAVDILRRVDVGGAFANILLHATLAGRAFAAADQALLTELVMGTLRRRGRLDHALEIALDRPLDSLPPHIRAILRAGLYQAWFLDRVPTAAAVHTSVDLARRHGHRGTAALVNAVLRRLTAEGEPPPPSLENDPVGHLAVVHSHPRWLVARWISRMGAEETRALCEANNAVPPTALRVNRLRADPGEVIGRLRGRGMEASAGRLPESVLVRGSLSARLDLYDAGLVTMQDEGSMEVARLVDPRAGETVLDAVAGSGGKATHLAELMGNAGRIIAVDDKPAKLRALSAQAVRLGLNILEAHQMDAREIGRQFRGVAERVLIDAPCTGLGVLRRRPEIRWRIGAESFKRMAPIQAALLAGAAAAVRPGGALVYAVCSIEPEEGEEIVAAFAAHHPAFALTERRVLLPHRDGTDGFFMARLARARTGSDT